METAPDLLPGHLQPPSEDKNVNKNLFNLFIEELGLKEFAQHKLTPADALSINRDVLSNDPCRCKKDIPRQFLSRLMSLYTNARNSMFCSSKPDQHSTTRREIPDDIRAHLSEPKESYIPSNLSSVDGTVHPLDVLCVLLHCSDSFLQQEIVTRLSMCQIAVPLLLPAGDGAECTFMLWAMRGIIKHLPSPTEPEGIVEENLVNIPMPVISFVRLGECKNMSKSTILNQVLSFDSNSCREDFLQMSCGKRSRIISDGLVEITWHFPTKNTRPCCPQRPFAVANLHGDIRTNQRQFGFLASVSSAVFVLVEGMAEFRELLNEESDKFYFVVGHPSHNFWNDQTKHLLEASFCPVAFEQNLVGKLQEIIKNTITENPTQRTLTELVALGSAFGLSTDEDQTDCQYAKFHHLELSHDVITATKCHQNYLRTPKELRLQLADAEKEMYRLIRQGKSNSKHLKSVIDEEMQKSLLMYLWSDVVTDLVYAFHFMSRSQKQYFLKWMWAHCPKANASTGEARQMNIFFDLANIYQAEAIIVKATEYVPRCSKLPKIAADLLLNGFPLALISEDTFSVHLQWITDVLTELVNKTKGACKVRVISALGVHRSGKSSLLYTMFGLQFQVTRPLHTRGALLSLIKVDESFKQELGCDFLLVIDTQGLRPPKLASSKQRYDQDNALATFVIGISDVVILCLPSENPSDTINILQIAVCAFLRMKDSERKPTLYFVQTNATKASSDGEISHKNKIYEGLNETIDLAAKVVQRASYLSLNDVLKCDFSSSHWYNVIPGLWQGDPFNGCINPEYAERVMRLKQHLIRHLTQDQNQNRIRTMLDFVDDVKSLWDAVNLEPIFRFEHIKEVITYTELSNLYGELEWGMRKELHQWTHEQEVQVPVPHSQDTLRKDMLEQLQRKKQEKIQAFRSYLDSDKKQFEEEFTGKFKFLSEELETFYEDKCAEIQVLRSDTETAVVEDFRNQEWDPDELQDNFDFDSFWKDKVGQLEVKIVKKRDVRNEFLQMLKTEMKDRGSLVVEVLRNVKGFPNLMVESFDIDEKHIDATWYMRSEARDLTKPWRRLETLVKSLTKRCNSYVLTMVKLDKDYEPIHCLKLLRTINRVLRKEAFPFTDLFEVSLKLYILSRAAAVFQATHNALVKAKGEQLLLEKQKPPPINTLKSIIQDKSSAKRFCHLCLKPFMELDATSSVQPYVIQDIGRKVSAVKKSTETSQILCAIKDLQLINIYNDYSPDCDSKADVISSVTGTFRRVLESHPELIYNSINELMTEVSWALDTQLSLSHRDMAENNFKVTCSTTQQFSNYVDFFLRQLKSELQPNRDTIRNIILRVCEKLCGRKQDPHCKAPYDVGLRSHQRNLRPLHRRRKPSKIKGVGPHCRPKEVPNRRVRDNTRLMKYLFFAMNKDRNFRPITRAKHTFFSQGYVA